MPAQARIPLGASTSSQRRQRLRHLRHAPVVRRRQRQPRRRPGRPAGLAAADGGRLLGDRQRRARAAPPPRSAGRGRRRALVQTIQPAARATIKIDPATRAGRARRLHAAASAPGGTSTAVWARLGPDRYPVYGKTGTAQTPRRRTTSRGTSAGSRTRAPERSGHRHRGDDREGRLRRRGRGARRAPDRVEVVRRQGQVRRRDARRRDEHDRRSSEPDAARRPPRRRRAGCCRFDPRAAARRRSGSALLARDVHGATGDDIAGTRTTTSRARPSTSAWASCSHAGLARDRLLAAARAEVRPLRPADRLDPARLRARLASPAARGARSSCRSSPSRPPSWARCCFPGAVGVRRRPHRARLRRPRHDRAASCCCALVPAALVMAQPDLGSAWSTSSSRSRCCSWPARLAAFRRAVRARRVAIALVFVAAPAAGVTVLQAVPEGPPDGLPATRRDNPAKQGYQQNQSKIAIGAGQKTGRGDKARPRRARLPARAPHGLHLRGGRGALRVRRRGAGAVALRAADLARAANPDPGEEPVRRAGRRRHRRDADVPGLRQRRHDHRHHADHRHPAAAHELWRPLGHHHLAGPRAPAVDLRAGPGRRGAQGPRADLTEKETPREKASAGQRRSRGDPRRAAGGDRHAAAPRASAAAAAKKDAAATASPSSTSSAAATARSSATSTRARSTTSCRASRRRSSTSAWTRTASCTSTRSCCRASRSPRRGRGRAASGKKISELLKPGQEIVVQVVKDPLKTKGARLSMELTIAGRYMVYAPTGEGIGVSKRLDDKERERLRKRGPGPRPRTAAARSSAPPPRAPSARTSSASCSTSSSSTRCSSSASRRRRRRRWSSRRPTCRCASCATSSAERLRARDRRRREAAPPARLVLLAHRARARRPRRAAQGARSRCSRSTASTP